VAIVETTSAPDAGTWRDRWRLVVVIAVSRLECRNGELSHDGID